MSSERVSDELARVEVDWRRGTAAAGTAGRRIEVGYRFHNLGDTVLALIDQGAVDERGEVRPRLLPEAEGLTITLVAAPLPDPAPTHPEVALARKVAPGDVAEGTLRVRIPETMVLRGAAQPGRAPVLRVRLCLGYAPFSEAGFVPRGEAWIPTVKVIDTAQRTLCTGWFELAG